jgi:hypothetical protein
MDREEKRIAKALGAQDVPEVDGGNLLKYKKYLLERMDKGTVLIGREEFPREGDDVIASGNLAEYERLKKENCCRSLYFTGY